MKRFVAVVGLIGWSWALVASADARHAANLEATRYEVIVREVRPSWDDALAWETPLIDSMFTDDDWTEMDRQSDCLFEFLKDEFGHEITMNRVLAAGYWTDELGGACAVIGEDDE